jgi:bifunctional non-homologous end joining protein LigD
VLVPLKSSYDFDEVRAVAKTIGQLVHRRLPRLTTTKPNAGRRTRKVYLDYVRNSFGQTLVAPYSLRAFPGATVSTPLAWNELTQSLRPTRFTLRTIFRRLNKKGDVWEAAFRRTVSLRSFARRLERMQAEGKHAPKRAPKPRRKARRRRHRRRRR